MHKTQPASLDRNYGIDLLRLVSMFLVTILHVLNQGGALDAASGVNQYVGACMMLFTMCSVNCFGIISGYVLYSEHEHPYRFSKYFSIWLQVFLYSFGLTLLSHLSGLSKVTPKALLASALPLTTDRYWYFTAYTGVFFLAPWLNKLVRGSSRAEMNKFALCLFLLFSCFASVGPDFGLNRGYSFLWLFVLYLLGAWLKKCAVAERVHARCAVLCIIINMALSYAVGVLLNTTILGKFISPTVLAISVSLVILFSRIRFGELAKKWIVFWAPAAFGVYLIHVHKTVWNMLIKNRFAWIAEAPTWLYPLLVLLSAAAVFAACLVIDRIRSSLFRLLRINSLGDKLFRLASNCAAGVFKKLYPIE